MASDWNGTYIWRVENWTELTEEKIYSPEFEIGTYSWRLMVLPRGSENLATSDYIALYLDFPEASFTPPHMCPKAKFELIAVKSNRPEDSIRRVATHTFTAQAADWGFTQFLPMPDARNPRHGFLVNDVLTFRVSISIERDANLEATPPPTRDMTFLGLRKQEDGGYMNCLLQCLFHIGSFREAVYRMPVPGQEASEGSVLGAVQSLFYQLQYHNSVANAGKLKEAMGWKSTDAVAQHDLQKMHSTLLGTLGHRIRDHKTQSVTSTLFRGRVFQCLECLSVQYASTWKRAYTEIQLDVLGCKDIYESLERFCRFKGLQGMKKRDTSLQGFADSRQGALFEGFPSVLQFHLKRFFCDPDRKVMLKINCHHEFYDELDLDFDDRALLPKNADKTVDNKYRLHSVIAHRDGPNGGHYFAFIRPNEQWYKFDDEDVEEVSAEDAINKQFGTEDGPIIETLSPDEEGESTHSMACTLVYIRQSEWERVKCEAGKEDIPETVRERLQSEAIKEQIRDESKAHLYVVIKLACEKHFYDQLGKSYYFDLANFDGVKNYRIRKKTSFEDFKEMVRKDFGIPKYLQRFWVWNQRPNSTIRVSKPLNESDIDVNTLLDLRHFRDKGSSPEQEKMALMTIKLFLELPEKAYVTADALHTIQKNELLIFLKYYDPELTKLSYLGHMFVEMSCQFHLVAERAKKMAGLAPEDEVVVFEEIKHSPAIVCLELLPETTPENVRLIQGDILIIQKITNNLHCQYPTVKSFLEFIQSRVTVTFRPLKHPTDEGAKLELLKTLNYEQVTNALAKRLQIDDPKKLRLTQHDMNTRMPQKRPMKYNGMESLKKMMVQEDGYSGILYYEVLDKQLPYLESLKCLTIRFHNAKGAWQSEHHLTMPKDDKVTDLVKTLKLELGKEYSDCDMRVMEIHSSKVFKILDHESDLEQLYEQYWTYRAEVIPEDQKQLKPDEFLVLFCHCEQDNSGVTVFGDPLWVKLRKGETVKEVKTRIQKTLEISDAEFMHWRFAYHARSMHPVEYLSDKDEILTQFSGIALSGKMNGEFLGDNTSFIAMVHEHK